MTNSSGVTWNLFVVQFAAVYSIVTFVFMTICQTVIKMSFKTKKMAVRQKFKSILSFKVLRIILGIFIVLSSYLGLTFLDYFVNNRSNLEALALPAPFVINVVGIAILLVFLLGNEDAKSYLRIRMNAVKTQVALRFELRRQIKKREQTMIQLMTSEATRNLPTRGSQRSRNVDVCMIDLETGQHNIVGETTF